MKKEIKEDEIYVLGQHKIFPAFFGRWCKRTKRIAVLLCIAVSVPTIYLAGKNWLFVKNTAETTLQEKTPDIVSMLPEGSKPPRFNRTNDITEFYRWIGRNLKYPEGYESRGVKVVVSFVVQKNGRLGKFRIIRSPEEKAFENAVIDLLENCPPWEPAELADGTPIGIEFTLPVTFQSSGNNS